MFSYYVLTFALILLLPRGRLPWQIVEEWEAILTVVPHCVVGAVALAVDHAGDALVLGLLGEAALGVAVARAGAAHGHVVDRVVVFLLRKINIEKDSVLQSLPSPL